MKVQVKVNKIRKEEEDDDNKKPRKRGRPKKTQRTTQREREVGEPEADGDDALQSIVDVATAAPVLH